MKSAVTFVTSEAWLEWRNACTIGRCGDATKKQLAKFGNLRLKAYLSKLDAALVDEYCNEKTPTRAWLTLEQFLYSAREGEEDGVGGKSYKQQLFRRTATPAEMEGYLSQVFRQTIARKIVRAEGIGVLRTADGRHYQNLGRIASLDAPLNKESGDTTLGEILADKISDSSELIEPAANEPDAKLLETALSLATAIWQKWRERERVVFVLRLHGVEMATILESGLAGDCKKTQLYVSYSRVKSDIEEADWGYETGKRQCYYLSRFLFRELAQIAGAWLAEAEKGEAIRSMIDVEQSLNHGINK